MKALIVSGGKAPSYELLKSEIAEETLIIGVDSGANCLYKYGIEPNLLIGDFDSIEPSILEFYKGKNTICKVYPSEKDYTDTQLAVIKAIEKGANVIVLLGCTGTRVDHFLGNLGMLKFCSDKNIAAFIKDENNSIFLVDKDTIIEGKKDDTFSLQAYCDEVINLTIEGAKYPLDNYTLKLGDPRTISNQFCGKKVKISFTKGKLLILYSRD